MPAEGVKWKAHDEILSYEEIVLFARAAVDSGISRIRLTGGEPLVRKDVVNLVRGLCEIPGLRDLSLTTNGLLLKDYASSLARAGLKRVNISIDSLNAEVYGALTRGGDLKMAMRGMKTALAVGLSPVKINAVILRGVNDDLKPFVDLVREFPVHVRFIEHMPFNKEIDPKTFVSSKEMKERIEELGKLEPANPPVGAGPAKYFYLRDALGTIGFISPISRHFCLSCNRLRLTADGRLKVCLFSDEEVDVRALLKTNPGREEIKRLIVEALLRKPRERESLTALRIRRGMSQIGG
jgi:cyclic pyranopterin phosphate synthase